MSMINPDVKSLLDTELKNAFKNAVSTGDENQIAEAMSAYANAIQENIIQQARTAADNAVNDRVIMESRGSKTLTKAETDYYNSVISGNSFSGAEQLMPPTVFERVFEDLVMEHPLLNYIDSVNTTSITKWIVKNGEIPGAWWGKLCSPIRELMDDGFDTYETELYKLSAYLPVCKPMLALGPQWLDRYVTTVLAEAMSIGLEEGIVAGTGKEEPIGMMKNLSGAVVEGIYPDKGAVPITDLSPVTFGKEIVAPLTNGGKRKVSSVILVVNPVDYWTLIYPQTTILNTSAGYVYGVLPFPANIVQSAAMPTGKMIAGLGKNYFLGLGSSRVIEYSDEYKFVEDERTYLTKIYANGRPKDNISFMLFDISNLTPPVVTGSGSANP